MCQLAPQSCCSSPSAQTRGPKSPHSCQHLALPSFLGFLAEHSGCCYQRSCSNNVLSLLSPALSFPRFLQLSSPPQPTLHCLLTTSTSCLHCCSVFLPSGFTAFGLHVLKSEIPPPAWQDGIPKRLLLLPGVILLLRHHF